MNITITVKTISVHAVSCCVCGLLGPPSYVEDSAGFDALKEGWKVVSYHDGQRCISDIMCPQCYSLRRLSNEAP